MSAGKNDAPGKTVGIGVVEGCGVSTCAKDGASGLDSDCGLAVAAAGACREESCPVQSTVWSGGHCWR